MLPQAVCVSSGETLSLIVHRVTHVIDALKIYTPVLLLSA